MNDSQRRDYTKFQKVMQRIKRILKLVFSHTQLSMFTTKIVTAALKVDVSQVSINTCLTEPCVYKIKGSNGDEHAIYGINYPSNNTFFIGRDQLHSHDILEFSYDHKLIKDNEATMKENKENYWNDKYPEIKDVSSLRTFIQYATEIPKDKFLSKLNKEINHKPGPNEKNKAKQPNKNIIIPIPRNQKRKTNKIVITARDKKQVLNSSKKVLKTIKQYTLNNH